MKTQLCCDVHMLVTSGRYSWRNAAINSIRNEPCYFRTLPGIKNHIGLGRYNGFSKGTCEYISYIDDDDLIVSGILKKLIELLDRTPEAAGAFSLSIRIDSSGRVLENSKYLKLPPTFKNWNFENYSLIHQLVVYRRQIVEKYLPILKEENKFPEMILNRLICREYKFICLPEVGYYWRIHSKGIHKSKLISNLASGGNLKNIGSRL